MERGSQGDAPSVQSQEKGDGGDVDDDVDGLKGGLQ